MSAMKDTFRAIACRRGCERAAKNAGKLALSAFAAAITLAPSAAAQGCAMCYQSAAGSGNHSIVALQHGILLLLIPSVGLFAGIFGLIYSRRNVSR
jgi:hypothetical protein